MIYETSPLAASGAGIQGETAPGRAPAQVLVVDDQAATLNIMQRMLEALGLRVVAADGGKVAMDCLNRYHFDLMLTDLQMPEMDGYALARWLKQRWRDTPVIIMTGACPAVVTDFMNGGVVDHWMFKPFSLIYLAEVLQRFVPVRHPA